LSDFSVFGDEGALLVLTSKEWHDLHASDYDASYEGKKWVEIYDRITWEKMIEPYLPRSKSMSILDAGGGTGKWTIPVARLGYHVTLADISEKMLEMAKEKLARENLLDRVSVAPADVTSVNDMIQSCHIMARLQPQYENNRYDPFPTQLLSELSVISECMS